MFADKHYNLSFCLKGISVPWLSEKGNEMLIAQFKKGTTEGLARCIVSSIKRAHFTDALVPPSRIERLFSFSFKGKKAQTGCISWGCKTGDILNPNIVSFANL